MVLASLQKGVYSKRSEIAPVFFLFKVNPFQNDLMTLACSKANRKSQKLSHLHCLFTSVCPNIENQFYVHTAKSLVSNNALFSLRFVLGNCTLYVRIYQLKLGSWICIQYNIQYMYIYCALGVGAGAGVGVGEGDITWKSGVFQTGIQKNRVIHIPFVEKRGPIIYLDALQKGAIYRKLPPPPTHTHTHSTPSPPKPPTPQIPEILRNWLNIWEKRRFSKIKWHLPLISYTRFQTTMRHFKISVAIKACKWRKWHTLITRRWCMCWTGPLSLK